MEPARIAELAAQGDPVARQAIDDFFDILASFSGDMALAVWATGGVYISGAVVQKLSSFLDENRFRARFQAKGRLEAFCAGVAIGWMRAEEPGLLGCVARMRSESGG
jgi:glucokinase